MCKGDLTPKQMRFVDEYLIDLNATAAAIRAGYSEKTANEIGSQNLVKLSIQKAIAERLKERQQRTEITQDYVLRNLKKIAEKSMGYSDAPHQQAATKALELLGKSEADFVERQEITGHAGALPNCRCYPEPIV